MLIPFPYLEIITQTYSPILKWISDLTDFFLNSKNLIPGVVACTCNPAALEAEFRNSVGSVPVGGNSPSIGGWIVWPPVIQH